jgi:hypothetical protein
MYLHQTSSNNAQVFGSLLVYIRGVFRYIKKICHPMPLSGVSEGLCKPIMFHAKNLETVMKNQILRTLSVHSRALLGSAQGAVQNDISKVFQVLTGICLYSILFRALRRTRASAQTPAPAGLPGMTNRQSDISTE